MDRLRQHWADWVSFGALMACLGRLLMKAPQTPKDILQVNIPQCIALTFN